MGRNQNFSISEIGGLRYIFVITSDVEDSSLIHETVNFLVKTGMPEISLRSVLIRTGTGDLYQYLDKYPSRSRRRISVSLRDYLDKIYSDPQSLYFLFLAAGAKISWGSFDCLHRAATAMPDAAIISAVFRSRSGRVKIPKQAYAALNPWAYIKTLIALRSSETINVDTFFKEAVLIRGEAAVEVMSAQGGLDEKDLRSAKYYGHFVCVLSAQLV